MDIALIDQVKLNFNPKMIMIINFAIGLMMFGVALDMRLKDFKKILKSPKAPAIGLIAQFILLPMFTYLLILIIKPHPSIALGMILVASCPGGNLSNVMTYLAKGNTAISVSMTAISTVVAIFMTPLNLSIWGNLYSPTRAILQKVHLSPVDIFITIFLILGVPVILGMIVSKKFPNLSKKARKPFKIFSLIFFIIIVIGALMANWKNFIEFVGIVAIAVFIHNVLALNIGYWSAHLGKLKIADKRAIAIEVGIQNSALGLALVFSFFGGLGGMAIVVAWWGIWHIIAGLTTAFIFTRKTIPEGK